jgi:hypothetical protein
VSSPFSSSHSRNVDDTGNQIYGVINVQFNDHIPEDSKEKNDKRERNEWMLDNKIVRRAGRGQKEN